MKMHRVIISQRVDTKFRRFHEDRFEKLHTL